MESSSSGAHSRDALARNADALFERWCKPHPGNYEAGWGQRSLGGIDFAQIRKVLGSAVAQSHPTKAQ
jgi:hypothetical protein